MNISGAPEAPFFKTLTMFCTELKLTFPELSPQVDRAVLQTPQTFWRTWVSHINILIARDFDLLTANRRGIILGAVAISPALWKEVSSATHDAIWRYLRTLVFEAAMEIGMEQLSPEVISQLLVIFGETRNEEFMRASSGDTTEDIDPDNGMKFLEHSAEHLLPFLHKLKSFVGGDADISDISLPEIPEHLRNGHIARLAEDLAKQFKPEEFGIDASILTGDSVEEVLRRLIDLYQRDPTVFIGGLKRIAEKIKRQIMGGSINREQLLAEAKEYFELFKSIPLFKGAFDKVQGLFGDGGIAEFLSGGASSSGTPSERLRAVQERLRRKVAARNADAKTSAQGK